MWKVRNMNANTKYYKTKRDQSKIRNERTISQQSRVLLLPNYEIIGQLMQFLVETTDFFIKTKPAPFACQEPSFVKWTKNTHWRAVWVVKAMPLHVHVAQSTEQCCLHNRQSTAVLTQISQSTNTDDGHRHYSTWHGTFVWACWEVKFVLLAIYPESGKISNNPAAKMSSLKEQTRSYLLRRRFIGTT